MFIGANKISPELSHRLLARRTDSQIRKSRTGTTEETVTGTRGTAQTATGTVRGETSSNSGKFYRKHFGKFGSN